MTQTFPSNGCWWMYDRITEKWMRAPRNIKSFGQALHELRKAHKGLRKQARKIKAMKAELKELRYIEYQYYMAMTYMAGFVKIQPYEGWIPEVQFWIDMFERHYQSVD